jgi:hypothetical protein
VSNKQALVVGCSLSAGYGMPGGVQHPRLWINQLLAPAGYQVHNHSRTGASNSWIFHQAVKSMQQSKPDLVLVQWTYLARLNWRVGLEVYDTWSMLADPGHDVNLVNHETIPASWLSDIGNRLQLITNDHWHILQLVQYVNVLVALAHAQQCQIVFVNGAVGWPNNFFTPIEFELPSELPEYVQGLLSVAKRSDTEIKHLYNMIYDEYNSAGGIHPANWLNLYSSLNQCKIDTILPGDQHPGWLSQDHYCQILAPHLLTL